MSMASWRKTGICLCAGVAALVGGPVPPLYASSGHDASREAVAPNQSVSVLEADHAVDVEPVAGAQLGLVAKTGSPADEAVAADAPAASSTVRWVRRRSAARSGTEEPPRQTLTVPWYRSSLVSLAIVLSLVAGVYWLARRFVPSFRTADSAVLRVVARSAVSPKHNVALLRIGRRFVLIGLSGERITPLAEITDGDEVAELVAKVGDGIVPAAKGFDKLIAREADAFDLDLGEGLTEAGAGDRDSVAPSRRVAFHGSALSQLKDRLRGLQAKR